MNRSALRLILHVSNKNHSRILCIFLKSNFRKPLFEYFPPLFCTHDTIEASLLFGPVREYFCENPTAKASQIRVTLLRHARQFPKNDSKKHFFTKS